jgi:hypothetical protein
MATGRIPAAPRQACLLAKLRTSRNRGISVVTQPLTLAPPSRAIRDSRMVLVCDWQSWDSSSLSLSNHSRRHHIAQALDLFWQSGYRLPLCCSNSRIVLLHFNRRSHFCVNKSANALRALDCVARFCVYCAGHCLTPDVGATGVLVCRWFRRLLRLASSASFCVILRAGIVLPGL